MNELITVEAQAVENAHTSGVYSKRPLTVVRGAGCTVWDADGNAYLDATSGMGVALLGHAHAAVVDAISRQAATLITCAEIFYNDRRAELYSLLNEISGFERFFLCNSGAEAIEGALKAARLLRGRSNVVAAKRSFHGRTLGSLGLTWNSAYREPFTGWTPNGITHIPYNDLDAARAAINGDTAAIVIEAVQGEGGVYVADAGYLRGLRELCDQTGALLIVDEIQTGLGRTGRWFGFQHSEMMPDMIALGKGLAGGVPMGAVAWRGSLGGLDAGTHGSTFGGNPLACAAAIATLTTLRDENLPHHSAQIGGWLLEQLNQRLPTLTYAWEVRGCGLMIGIELRGRVTPVIQALQARGVLALVAGKTVLRLLPPLTLTQAEAEQLLETVSEVLRDVSA